MSAPVDEKHMARCIELARKGEGLTAPNPMVGCVIVNPRGKVVAEGWHRRLGAPHAEIDALAKLGGKAPGCTLYCNLEPCNHRRNRRTSPCAPTLAQAGIARLVMGMGDPIRSHAGGAAWLQKQGVKVVPNVLRARCADLNRAFVTWARHGRPHMVLKAGITLDGKIATRAGQSQWITSEQARKHSHMLRSRLQAIMVGIGTVLGDDPRLTARVRGGKDPIRIVVDGQLRTPPSARLLPASSPSSARVIIATTETAPGARARALEDAGATVWRVNPGAQVDVRELLRRLGQDEITSVLVEGGATLHGSLMDADLVDELILYLAPIVVGGASPAWVGGTGVATLCDAPRFRFAEPVEHAGPDLVVRARRWRPATIRAKVALATPPEELSRS
jgi:diaminohydroxyphosphoribosylaminopyrimidine deaminase / 5-amino-6-(5-phosphoribosylamino)uracil reductase